MLLFQTTVPLELPQVKPRRPDDGKEPGTQLRGPISELRPAAGSCPKSLGKDSVRASPLEGLQKAPFPPRSVADHLEDELDMLLHLDAPVKEEDSSCLDQTSPDQEPERDGQVAQEETGMAFILFPIHLLSCGVFMGAVPPHHLRYPSVSAIDPAESQASLPLGKSQLPLS